MYCLPFAYIHTYIPALVTLPLTLPHPPSAQPAICKSTASANRPIDASKTLASYPVLYQRYPPPPFQWFGLVPPIHHLHASCGETPEKCITTYMCSGGFGYIKEGTLIAGRSIHPVCLSSIPSLIQTVSLPTTYLGVIRVGIPHLSL